MENRNKKNYIVYALILTVGILMGWLIFGGSATNTGKEHDHNSDMAESTMWTCSMHPQIMSPEPGDCPICGMDLIPAESSADGLAAEQFKMTDNALALANVQTTLIGSSMTGNSSSSLSGTIMHNEEENSVQVSYFSGRIERLNINFTGEEIRKGQLLATIYSPELFAAQQELITASSLKESQPALYKAVRNKLKIWKLSDNQIDQIESSGKVQENFPVYATVSGTVTEKLVQQGDYIKQGQPLLKVSDLTSVWAQFDVYENQIDRFKKGQDIEIITNAYPNKIFNAKVSFIDPILNNASRTVKLRAELSNKENLLKPGMFVKGKIDGVVTESAESITVPASAVLWTGEKSVVYIKTDPEQPIFEMRKITLGNKMEDTYQVLEGIQEGDIVVTNGTFTIDAAAQLQGKRSMMNQSSANNAIELDNTMKMELPKTFSEDFKNVLVPYNDLKNALVNSDKKAAKTAAKTTLDIVNSINGNDLDNMLKSHLTSIKEMLVAIFENDELENQRDHFVILNENIVAIAANIEGLGQTFFVQRCPMANNNKGAIWLSLNKEIENPYFGEAMMNCGEVIKTLK